jgi:hypothetical protein
VTRVAFDDRRGVRVAVLEGRYKRKRLRRRVRSSMYMDATIKAM